MRWHFGMAFFLGASAFAQMPSALVKPATVNVQQAMTQVRPDKWKVSRQVKDATAANVDSINRDISGMLANLLTSADSAPNSLASLLPLSRNINALYDVLLRVVVVSETGAPRTDADALAQALSALQQARHAVDDRVQTEATSESQQVIDVRKQLADATAAAAVRPAPVPCVPTKPTPKTKKKTTSAAATHA